jgi:tryptophan-rich sensory protein
MTELWLWKLLAVVGWGIVAFVGWLYGDLYYVVNRPRAVPFAAAIFAAWLALGGAALWR